MDEDTGAITRQALGRAAFFGDLYDAKTDKFCGRLFAATPEPSAIHTQDNHHSNHLKPAAAQMKS